MAAIEKRALATVAVALAICAGGCDSGAGDGGEEARAGVTPGPRDVAWKGTPRLLTPKRLPNDRILYGEIKNDSLRPVQMAAAKVRLVDRRGRRVAASVVFLKTYVHGLYPPSRRPKRLPEEELRRTGRKAVIAPGATAPITVAWRQRAAGARPERLELGAAALPLPGSS